MEYVVVFLAGFAAAAAAIGIGGYSYACYLANEKRRLRLACDQEMQRLNSLYTNEKERLTNACDSELQRLKTWSEDEGRKFDSWRERLRSDDAALGEQASRLDRREKQHDADLRAFEARLIHYDSLQKENASLKRDIFNQSVHVKKLNRDHAALTRQQEELERKTDDVAARYLKESVSWVAAKLNASNFSTCKKRLLKVIEVCREIGFDIPAEKDEELVADLKENYEQVLRADFAKEEQARIRAQIREEERFAKEIDKKIREAEREQSVIQGALEKALEKAQDKYSAEVEHLRARLKEAEENAQRAKSQAQMTRAGHVYVISNIGSFGEGVFKIGMTRRLEPLERVRELSGASVPFPFDVHMMISSDDAPSLENALHRELRKQRMNKVNFRKEFFRVDIEAIQSVAAMHHGKVDYVIDPEALQYRETLEMPDEDYEFIEGAAQSLSEDEDAAIVDE